MEWIIGRREEDGRDYGYMPVENMEIRADEAGGPQFVRGYAAVFDALSEPLGGFREKIKAGAFQGSLNGEREIYALWQHRNDEPIGHTHNGLLFLEEDDVGLRFEIRADAFSADQLKKIKNGTVRFMSFAFSPITDEWEQVEDEDIRTLVDVNLFEVSPVTAPAYRQTSAAVRSLSAAKAAWEKRSSPPVKVTCGECESLRQQVSVLTQRLEQSQRLRARERELL